MDRGAQASAIASRRGELAARIVARHFDRTPDLAERFGPAGRTKCAEDAAEHLSYLTEAVAHDSHGLFVDYAQWVRDLLVALGISGSELVGQLRVIEEVLAEELTLEESACALGCLTAGIASVSVDRDEAPESIASDAPHADLAAAYLDALLGMRRQEALALVMDAAEEGVPVDELYLDVFQVAQREVGRLWQMNRISVAVEHYCTAATQLAMAQLYPRVLSTPKSGRCVLAAGVGGDLHEIGIRMVSDLLELDGWSSFFLGTNVPNGHVAEVAAKQHAPLLALSVTVTSHLSEAAALIEKVRAHPGCGGIRILVGGRPFLVEPELWRRIGADATAPDARKTLEVAARLFTENP